MGILIPFVLIVISCLVIWRACDGFEIASLYLGRNLSEGVRGGTINAISSSIPELLTTVIALFALADEDGFAVGLGTTAGSALFNGMIIPAACIFTVVGAMIAGKRVSAVTVSSKVILRDGLTLLACEMVIIYVISDQLLRWWQGLILVLMYCLYFAFMLLSMRASGELGEAGEDAEEIAEELVEEHDSHEAERTGGGLVYWLSGGPLLDLEDFFVGEKQRAAIAEQRWNAWPLLIASTAFIGVACWLLVHACEWLGTGPGNQMRSSYELFGQEFQGLGMPAIFVAVIFASMATSVPDTVMSIRDARKGEYDDAVANALGSNIFDICFALGLPVMVFTLINGPIEMPEDVANQTGEILLLLLSITLAGFFVYYLGPRETNPNGTTCVRMGRLKAGLLIALYVVFVAFVVGRSQNAGWAVEVSQALQEVLVMLRRWS